MTQEPTAVINVRLGRPIAELFDDAARQAGLIDRVAAGLDKMLRQLGIPGEPEIIVQRVPHDARPLRVQIGDSVYAYADEWTERLWETMAGSGPPSTPFAWSHWTADASGLDFLARIVVEIVKRHPERVLTADHLRVYAGPATPAPELEEVLGSILKMGIALPEPAVVLEEIASRQAQGASAAECADQLIAVRRPRTVQIKLRPEDLEQLLDRDVTGPVAISDLALPDDPFAVLREGLFYELGLRVPPVVLVPSADVPAGCVVVRLNELDGPPTRIVAPSEALVDAEPASLRHLDVPARPAVNPATGAAVAVIDQRDLDTVKTAGLWTWTALGHVVLVLASELRRHAGWLIDTDTIERELALLSQTFPQLVEAVLEVVSITDVTRVVRGLLHEEVSVRDLRGILERLVTFDRVVADTVEHTVFDDRLVVDPALAQARLDDIAQRVEHVRAGLKAQLAHRYTGGSGGLNVWMLDKKTESRLLDHLAAMGGVGNNRLSPGQLDEIREAIRQQLESAGASPVAMFTLTSLRPFVRELIRDEFPRVPVLAHTDLPHSVHVEVLGRISL